MTKLLNARKPAEPWPVAFPPGDLESKMKAGRNDPCPCGSGQKYKKCCLQADRKVPGSLLPLGQASSAGPTPSPMGGLQISPYVIAKMAEDTRYITDPEHAAAVQRHIRENWTIRKVAALSTEAIETQLRAYGVAHTRQRFTTLAASRSSAWSISAVWQQEDPIHCRGKEVDFLGLAACELWKRLTPAPPSIEMIDDWMQDGYVLDMQQCFSKACDVWLRVWQSIQPHLTADMRITAAADAVFRGRQSILNWCQDFELCMTNAIHDRPDLAATGVAYCRAWLGQFTDEDELCQVNFTRALGVFQFYLGDAAAGEATLLGLVQKWPKGPWGYVAMADIRSRVQPVPGIDLDLAGAKAWLERGLVAVGGAHPDRSVLLERLECL